MFQSKKRQQEIATDEVLGRLAPVLSHLSDLEAGWAGIRCNGFSITQGQQGDGFLAVVRLHLGDAAVRSEDFPVDQVGDYVIFGWGDSPLRALANVEAQLALGEGRLSPDKYANKRR